MLYNGEHMPSGELLQHKVNKKSFTFGFSQKLYLQALTRHWVYVLLEQVFNVSVLTCYIFAYVYLLLIQHKYQSLNL